MATLRPLLGASVCMLLIACKGEQEQQQELPKLLETTRIDLPGPVKYCRPSVLPVRSFTAQVLFDSSGSMRGFNDVLIPLQEWNQQALSHVRSEDMLLSDQRFCFFSAGEGISRCAQARFGSASIPAGGNTNLDEAIRKSKGYDLTVILTDGVAATVDPTSDCAGGVDTSCVARALFASVQPPPGSPQDQTGGLWIVPLIAFFQGPYYTETRMKPESFQPAVANGSVLRDTGTNAAIEDPRADRAGKLFYSYRGPRLLAMLVIAKSAGLGRAYIASLAARRDSTAVRAADSPANFGTGIAALPPIEIYPGFIPSIAWDSETPESLPDGGDNVGTGVMTPRWENGFLKLDPTGSHDEARIELHGHPEHQTQECTAIRQLPAFHLRRQPSENSSVYASHWDSVISPLVRIDVLASKDRSVPCDSNAPVVEWQSSPAFLSGITGKALDVLSSRDPVNEPHRIYGLREMLDKFFLEVQPADGHWTTFARLRTCQT